MKTTLFFKIGQLVQIRNVITYRSKQFESAIKKDNKNMALNDNEF